jgi:hypothetical protein
LRIAAQTHILTKLCWFHNFNLSSSNSIHIFHKSFQYKICTTRQLLHVILARYYFLLCITYNISGFKVNKTQWGPTIRFSSLIPLKHSIYKECVTSVHHVTQLIFHPSAVISAREVVSLCIKTMTYWDNTIILYIHSANIYWFQLQGRKVIWNGGRKSPWKVRTNTHTHKSTQ